MAIQTNDRHLDLINVACTHIPGATERWAMGVMDGWDDGYMFFGTAMGQEDYKTEYYAGLDAGKAARIEFQSQLTVIKVINLGQ